MAASLIISVIGTLITTVSFINSNMPEAPSQAKIQYVIANDGAHGDLANAGGDMPDVRLFDETGEFLAGTYDPGNCPEGYTTCTTDVDTQEAPTYTLFTANNDAICIAWTGIAWAGGQRKYGFHPGNWAYSCDAFTNYNNGYWYVFASATSFPISQQLTWCRYYAGQAVPGLDTVDDVKCAWLDADGDLPTTAFQVHWPEFDGDSASQQNLDYYCREKPPVEYYTSDDPSTVWVWSQTARIFDTEDGNSSLTATKISVPSEESADKIASGKKRIARRFENDPRIIKSYYAKHKASELCDQTKNAAGQSFVSYAERLFCYMPSKTLYPFCDDSEDGPCWSDEENRVIAQGATVDTLSVGTEDSSIPDLSHISEVTVWGQS